VILYYYFYVKDPDLMFIIPGYIRGFLMYVLQTFQW
jgi:hypothetical protein